MKSFVYVLIGLLTMLQMGAAGFAIYYVFNGWTAGTIAFNFLAFVLLVLLGTVVLYLVWSLLRVVDVLAEQEKH